MKSFLEPVLVFLSKDWKHLLHKFLMNCLADKIAFGTSKKLSILSFFFYFTSSARTFQLFLCAFFYSINVGSLNDLSTLVSVLFRNGRELQSGKRLISNLLLLKFGANSSVISFSHSKSASLIRLIALTGEKISMTVFQITFETKTSTDRLLALQTSSFI